eukprot:scaffold85861_cov27-Tisochrysis_lutea.AAC.3
MSQKRAQSQGQEPRARHKQDARRKSPNSNRDPRPATRRAASAASPFSTIGSVGGPRKAPKLRMPGCRAASAPIASAAPRHHRGPGGRRRTGPRRPRAKCEDCRLSVRARRRGAGNARVGVNERGIGKIELLPGPLGVRVLA